MPENKYMLRFPPKAAEDLEDIYRYISEKLFAENSAIHLMERIEKSIMRLKDYPFSGSMVADEFLKKKGYQKLVVDNYIVFYLVNEPEKLVVVMRILYGGQKYQEIL
ncbi:MAG: toxin ParE1/3/4 [Thermosediminibacterales bacterium]|nr:toxin ParE1/3/4 [Thermosediminibacterales bacterium]MDK2836706.1 toxin ParE1/3/4 [Thermosediminibacterales bacterium]